MQSSSIKVAQPTLEVTYKFWEVVTSRELSSNYIYLLNYFERVFVIKIKIVFGKLAGQSFPFATISRHCGLTSKVRSASQLSYELIGQLVFTTKETIVNQNGEIIQKYFHTSF